MSDEQLVEKMRASRFSEEEISQWRQIIPGLEPKEKKELEDMVEQFAQERNVLASRQTTELIQLKNAWQKHP